LRRSMRITMLLPAVDKLRQQGLVSDPFLASLGLSMEDLRNPNFRLPIDQVDKLLALAKQALNCPHLGLVAGQTFELRNYGLLGYMLSYCDNMQELCELAPRYYRYLSSDRAPELELSGDYAITRHQISPGTAAEERTRAEMFVSAILRCAAVLSRTLPQLKKLEFEFLEPEYSALYAEYFPGTEISFGNSQTALYFDKEYLKTPLDFPDHNMKGQLRSQLDAVLQQEGNHSFQDKVKQILLTQDQGFAFSLTMKEIASILHTTSKTLSRRLKEEGTSFKELHHKTRHQYACVLLNNGDKIDAIALELGYADRSAFDRSFAREEGLTPAAYRNKQPE